MEIQIKKTKQNSLFLDIRGQTRLRESLSFNKVLPSKIRRLSSETMKNISKVNKFTFSQIPVKVFPMINTLLEGKKAYVTFISHIYSKDSVLEWASKNKYFLGQCHFFKKNHSKEETFQDKDVFCHFAFSWSYA